MEFEAQFRAIQADCEAHSTPLLVVLIPPVQAIRHPHPPAGSPQYDLPTRKAREVLDGLGIPCVDTTDELLKAGFERAFLRVDGHLSPLGNEVLRDCILQAIRQAPD